MENTLYHTHNYNHQKQTDKSLFLPKKPKSQQNKYSYATFGSYGKSLMK
jgi:hypothetical protein